tara:strand:- start:1863 stop:2264 length:402 start_codon:yes stop_codon:yes gene_type:complete
MSKKCLLALVLSISFSVNAAVSDQDAQQALCYVKINAPEFIYGDLPFSCENTDLFIDMMDHELREMALMHQSMGLPSDIADHFLGCQNKLESTESRVDVARQFYSLKDSPILSRNASMAMAITTVCKRLWVAD